MSGTDKIDVLENAVPYAGQIRICETGGPAALAPRKCSILLTPDQLREHARACLALADEIADKIRRQASCARSRR